MKKIFLVVFLLIGVIALSACNQGSGEKYFLDEYSKLNDKDHLIKNKTANEIFTASKNEEHFVLFFGFPECPWCQGIISALNETAKSMDIKEVWYWNPKEDRANLSEDYLKMLDLVGLKRPINENGELETDIEKQTPGYNRIAVPFIAVINSGKVDYYPHNQWPTTFADGENVSGSYTRMEVSGEYKVLSTFMWDIPKSEIYEEAKQNELKEALKKLFDISKCGTCSV